MSGKTFVVIDKEFEQSKIRFGKVEMKKDIPNAKFARVAIGYEGMPKNNITTIPKGGKNRRDSNTSLHILLRGEYDSSENRFKGLYSTGVYATYVYKKPRIPENISGYQLQTCLVKKDGVGNPDAADQVTLNVFESLFSAAKDWVVENKETLPLSFRNLSDKRLRKCVVPLHQPSTTKEDGTTYGETYWSRIGYWPANVYKGKKYSERFTVPFKGPGNSKLNPKTLMGTHGRVIEAFRVNHLNFITGDTEDEMKIKFDSDLADVNFTPTSREESNICGDNMCETSSITDDLMKESKGYGDVDHTKEYGDGASNSYGDSGDTDSESSESRRRRKKKEKKARRKKD